MDDTALSLADVRVTVPDGPDQLTILDGVDLQVAPGEVVRLSGQSGSGKSTLLAVAGLLLRPTSGRVGIGGVDVTDLSAARRTKLRSTALGIVYQSPNLFPSLSALRQVELVAHIAGRLDHEARDRARELLSAVGLDHRLHARPAELSGGERQRVGIARALINRPNVLLADEPTSALDPERGQAVLDLLVDEAVKRHTALVVVTHFPTQAGRADRCLQLESGRLSAVGI